MFALGALQCFHEDELEAMLCGVGEKWSVDKLAETIKCDHGCACSVTPSSHTNLDHFGHVPESLEVHWVDEVDLGPGQRRAASPRQLERAHLGGV